MTGTLATSQSALKPAAVADRAAIGIPQLTAKSTPVSADTLLLHSDADSAGRKVSFSDLLSTLGMSGLTDHRLLRADGTDAVQDSGITIDDSDNITGVNALTTGGNLTANGDATIGDGSTNTQTVVNGGAGFVRDLRFRTNGTERWIIRANADTESGSDAGSNLEIIARDDAGASLNTAIEITRSNSQVTLGGQLLASGGSAGSPGYTFSGDNDSGIFRKAANHIGISLGGTEAANITGSTLTLFTNILKLYEGGGASDAAIEIGRNRTADGHAYLDLTAVNGESDYSARLFRNTGANGYLDLFNKGTGAIRFRQNGSDVLVANTSRVDLSVPVQLPSYTVAGLPSGAAGDMAYCSDETGGAVPVFHDGTNWRRVTDRAVAA